MTDLPDDVTRFLGEIAAGDKTAVDRLLPLVYKDLRALARSLFGRQDGDITVQPTAMVHEAYLRLIRTDNPQWENRKHFFDVAAKAMRQLLVDEARRRNRLKRGGGWQRVLLENAEAESRDSGGAGIDPIALNEALDELEEVDERQARIMSLRYFAGLTVEETAEIVGMAKRTVVLDSRMAHAWLRRRLAKSGDK